MDYFIYKRHSLERIEAQKKPVRENLKDWEMQNNSNSSSSHQDRRLNVDAGRRESAHVRDNDSISIEPTENLRTRPDQSLLDQIIKAMPTEKEIQNRLLGGLMSVEEDPERRIVAGSRVAMHGKEPDQM